MCKIHTMIFANKNLKLEVIPNTLTSCIALHTHATLLRKEAGLHVRGRLGVGVSATQDTLKAGDGST